MRMLLLPFILLLSACSSTPESIQVDAATNLPTYEEVVSSPNEYQQQFVRWGGVIAAVENQPDGTMVELVQFPLRDYGRPMVSDDSPGRFRVYVDGFLDPVLYEKGRAITFTGKVAGVEKGTVGEQAYEFPTLKAKGYHLWKKRDQSHVTSVHLWAHPFSYHRYHPFYYPYYSRSVVDRNGRYQRQMDQIESRKSNK